MSITKYAKNKANMKILNQLVLVQVLQDSTLLTC